MELLKTLCEIPGVSGFEDEAQRLVMAELKPLCDQAWQDRLGNVIGLKRATTGNEQSRKVMFAAHVDEIGLMVTHVDGDGFIRFAPIGGFDACNLIAQHVVVHGRKKLNGVNEMSEAALMRQPSRE